MQQNPDSPPPASEHCNKMSSRKELWDAALVGDMEWCKRLLREGADIEQRGRGFGMTPVMAAAASGHLSVVQLLVENGAKINVRDDDGDSPLANAARNGHNPQWGI